MSAAAVVQRAGRVARLRRVLGELVPACESTAWRVDRHYVASSSGWDSVAGIGYVSRVAET